MSGFVVHFSRSDTKWALCRAFRGPKVSDDWGAVTCKACLAVRNQPFVGDYSHRHKAYSKAIAGIRERHRDEFEELYLAALRETP